MTGFVGDGIAEHDAVSVIPENHRVEERFGIGGGELELPVLAGVVRMVDAGLVAGSRGHEESFVGGEGNNGAEVERFGAGDLGGNPGSAGVGGSEVGPVCPRGPCDVFRHRTGAA